jgi:hypothetical protein
MREPRKSKLVALWAIANEITQEIERWLRVRDSKDLRLRFSPADQARLLKLRLWSYRYQVPIFQILDFVMPVLRYMTKVQKKSFGLGINIRTLTSYGTERILSKEIEKAYPDDEHKVAWRDMLQRQQLDAEQQEETEGLTARGGRYHNVLDASTVEAYVADYRSRVVSRRITYRQSVAAEWRRRRNYRFNPWK